VNHDETIHVVPSWKYGLQPLVLQSLRKYQSVMEFASGSAAARDFRALANAIDQLPPIQAASGRMQFFMERMLRVPSGG
jgi:flagellar biosynthesis protein FlhG